MNLITKQILGALIGGAIGNFVSGVVIEIIRIKESPEATEPYEHSDEYPEGDSEIEVEKTLLAKRPEKMKKPTEKKNYSQFFLSENRPDLAALAAKYNGEEVALPEANPNAVIIPDEDLEEEFDDENETDEEFIEEDEIESMTGPRVISLSEFANSDDYVAVKLNYYDDEVVTDERNNPIARPERILGEEALVSFGLMSEDEDVVYVRNPEKKAMYEVVRTNKNYAAPVERASRRRMSKKEEEDGEADDNT